MDNISVVIRTKNEEEFIGFAIQSCIDHFSDPEIIIVDDNSNDDTLKIISLFDKHDIKIVKLNSSYSPGKSINLGVSNCKNETVLVLSAHCQIIDLDLNKVKNLLKKYIAVFGNQTPIFRGKKITKRYIWSHFKDEDVINMYSEIEKRNFLHNAYCFYNKSFLIENKFDEKYIGKEDRYWAIEMVKNNYEYYYLSSARVNHFWTKNGNTWRGLS